MRTRRAELVLAPKYRRRGQSRGRRGEGVGRRLGARQAHVPIDDRSPGGARPRPGRRACRGKRRWRGLPVGDPSALAPGACFGELGLTGELRGVAHANRRVAEAAKFGLAPVLAPPGEYEGARKVESLRAALTAAI